LSQPSGDEDLTITKEADANSVDVGEELEYEITVTNEGDSEVSDLQIRDFLPDDVDVVDVDDDDSNIEKCTTKSDDEVRCDLETLGPGDEAVLYITIEPQEDADDEIENVAQLRLNGTSIQEASVETDVNDGGGGGGNNNRPPNRPPPFFDNPFFDQYDDEDEDSDEDEDGDEDSSINSTTEDDCIDTSTDTDTDTNTDDDLNSDNFEDSSTSEEDSLSDESASLESIDFENVAFQSNSNNDTDDDADGDDTNDSFSEDDSFSTEDTEDDDTDTDTLDECDEDDSPVSATSEDGQAEASTPGAVARSGGDPDDLEPERDVPDDVVDEVPFEGELPNTAGSIWPYVMPGLGCLLLLGVLVKRIRDSV
jgi:uncharacterized repeat protein (TIGR01451 family)